MSGALFWVMVFGAVSGVGVYLLYTVLERSPVSGPAALARLDAQRLRGRRTASLTADRRHQDESVRMLEWNIQ